MIFDARKARAGAAASPWWQNASETSPLPSPSRRRPPRQSLCRGRKTRRTSRNLKRRARSAPVRSAIPASARSRPRPQSASALQSRRSTSAAGSGCAPTSTDQMRMFVRRAKPRRLLLHVFDQFRPLNPLRPSGKVLHQRGNRKLSSRLVPLQNQRFQSRARRIERRRQSGAAGAKNHGIAYLCHGLPVSIVVGYSPASSPASRVSHPDLLGRGWNRSGVSQHPPSIRCIPPLNRLCLKLRTKLHSSSRPIVLEPLTICELSRCRTCRHSSPSAQFPCPARSLRRLRPRLPVYSR